MKKRVAVTAEKRISLAEFAAAHPSNTGGVKCWTCLIPEAEEINAQRRAGVSLPIILRWLREVRGYPEDKATPGKMHSHFSGSKHHLKRRIA